MGPKMYFAQSFDLPPISIKIDKARDLLVNGLLEFIERVARGGRRDHLKGPAQLT